MSAGAAAAIVSTHSENPSGTAGDGKTGRTDSQDIHAEVIDTEAKTPLPPGATWDPIAESTTEKIDGKNVPVNYARGMFVNIVQGQAQCKWYRYYQTGVMGHDQLKVRAAAKVIATMPDWEMTGNFAEGNPGRDILAKIVRDTQAGKASPELNQHVLANCD
ncbi:MAG TPA: hypothetical protein VHU91_02625 [Mycobacteriales bacterium]|nr:hypothetical protein [Mycobacteriales bacterium]